MRRAIVTGASRGIGRAVTEMLLGEDWEVIGVARTLTRTRADPHGLRWWWLKWDLAEEIDPEDAAAYFDDRPLDALVHCAGVRGPFGPFSENDPEAWARTIATNLLGTARVVRAALPRLERSEDARILLFSGGGAFSPEPNFSAYAATKGATVALMETWAEELSNTSVAVNCVAPGFIPTTIHAGTPHEHRQATPDAMGNVVTCVRHLLSPQTRGLTGRTISAQHDDWRSLSAWTIPHLGQMGQRDRHLISGLERLLIRARRAI